MEAEFVGVVCPTCFQLFEVRAPGSEELPVEWDYDCEICCRPMVIRFHWSEAGLVAEALGTD